MNDKLSDKFLFIEGLDVELKEKRSKIRQEIDEISEKTANGSFDFIRQILMITEDPKVIQRLAKGLALVATKLPELKSIESQLQVIDYSKQNPDWFRMALKVSDEEFDSKIQLLTLSLPANTDEANGNK